MNEELYVCNLFKDGACKIDRCCHSRPHAHAQAENGRLCNPRRCFAMQSTCQCVPLYEPAFKGIKN